MRVARAELVVDHHAAAVGHGEPGLPRQLVTRADTGGEHDELERHGVAPDERDAGDVLLALDALGRDPGVDRETELLDVPTQDASAGVVDLGRHQSRVHLDDVGLEAELTQGVGRLEAQQAATDHDTRS